MSKTGDWALSEEEKKEYHDDGYDKFLEDLQINEAQKEFEALEKARARAEQHILNVWVEEGMLELKSIGVDWNNRHTVDMTSYKDKRFFNAIWHASTEILPGLEVQVVIDGNNDCYVTTGSSGYVEFGMQPPVGMKLPIRCWTHTHPFGRAYFSGVDINTVANWQLLMKEAYVLGGVEHFGHWTQKEPYELDIFVDNQYEETQTWSHKLAEVGEEE